MTDVDVAVPGPIPVETGSPMAVADSQTGGRSVVGRQTARRAVRSGAVWGYVFGLYVASTAFSYASGYPTAAQRLRLADEFGSDRGAAAIAGPAYRLETVGGFTAWKCLIVLSVVGGMWGLLTGTKLLRGEEDSGRWELLLAGATTRRRAAGQAIAGLGGGLLLLWALTATIIVVVGRSSSVNLAAPAALFFSVALVAGAAMFLAVGALASQVAPDRHRAAGYAGLVLGIAYALRLVADSIPGLSWLRWATPLGWIEELQPLTHPHPVALLPICGFTAAAALAAVFVAGRRDVGAGILTPHATARPHLGLLHGPIGLGVRLRAPTVAAWALGTAAGAFLLGAIARQAASAVTASAAVDRVISRLGAHGVGENQYLGVAFLIVAVVVALFAAGEVTAIRREESEGRLDHLLVRPLSRTGWLLGRLALTTSSLAVLGVAAGLFAWVGTASVGSPSTPGRLLATGLNVVAPSLAVAAVGVLVLGLRPRLASAAAYGLLVWSLLVELLGGFLGSTRWLLDTSVFHQVAAAPAVAVDWTSWGTLIALAVVGSIGGIFAFAHRDVTDA